MTSDLIKQMRKARQQRVTVGKFHFTIRRPTDIEAIKLQRSNPMPYDVAREFVDGWDGVIAADLVPSGGSDAVPFDNELWAEWLQDRPEFWSEISNAVLGAFHVHMEKREEDAKN